MKMRPVVMLAQTPPPYHGQAVMTQVLKEVLQEEFEIYHVRMDFSATAAENKKIRFSKVWKLFSNLWKTVRLLRQHPGSVLYYPPAPGHWVPVLRDMILLSFCRPLAGRTVFHFHARGLCGFLADHRLMPSRPWKNPDHAIVLGPSARGDAEYVEARHIHEVPYGIDVPGRPERSVQNDSPVIFFAGFHTESKGIFDVLETARILKERGADFKIRTAGEWADDETFQRFERLCSEYGLKTRVTCLGRLEGRSLWNEYASADLFFFPTFFEHETFGVVLIEAMAFGLPVISTCWPGPVDVVQDGVTGVLCKPHDTGAFADRIEALIADPARRMKMGKQAELYYRQTYTREHYAKNLKTEFDLICSGG